ncbi:hypothetical protein ACHAWC_009446 [Mediolabrus comicus]
MLERGQGTSLKLPKRWLRRLFLVSAAGRTKNLPLVILSHF